MDRLLALMDRDPDFRYFNMDAQTIVLEDYLEIRPEKRPRLEQLIREGRITVGPWYQLNDEFLTSGEATVRSLLIGHRIAREFGACMKIGYLPDQFGNLSQMPQIFREFGIDNSIFGRGRQLVGDRKMEFIWRSPDGSEVLSSLMAFWYNNAMRLPAGSEEAVRYIEAIRERMTPVSAVSHLLLMNGVDHMEAQEDLSQILAELSRTLPDDVHVIHSTLPAYIDALRAEVKERGLKLDVEVGEMREDRGGSCLAGVLSSRVPIKQANHHAQITLERYAEPFSAFDMLLGAEYPHGFLRYAWKLLMQNHPHDSSCGCSIDQVHREMFPRFEQVEQVGEELARRALHDLSGRVAPPAAADSSPTSAIVVFNPLNWARTDPVVATLEFPLSGLRWPDPPRDDSRQVRGFVLRDEAGAEIPFALTHTSVDLKMVTNPTDLPANQWVQRMTIEFVATDVPACGYKSYAVETRPSMPSYSEEWDPSEYSSDSLDWLLDDGDIGDEYLYRRPLNDREYELFLPEKRFTQKNAVRLSMIGAGGAMMLPQSADANGRSDKLVECPVTLRSTKWRGVPRVEQRIEFDNRVRDHRLRCALMTPDSDGGSDAVLFVTDVPFDVVERPQVHPLEAEGALPFHPMGIWADATVLPGPDSEDEGQVASGVTVITRGLHTMEPGKEGELIVTLLRCVGQLSGRGDGPGIQTPDAQCLGKHVFELASVEHDGDWKEAKVWKQANQFTVPLRAVHTLISPEERRDLPSSFSFLTVEPDSLVVTAIKQAEDEPGTLVVRFFNTTDEPVEGARVSMRGLKRASRANMNEEPEEELAVAGSAVQLGKIGPKKIVTLSLKA
jgi:alpha-mannosidase